MATIGSPSPNQMVGPDGATRTLSERVARRVWVAAGGRCTMCNRYLLEDEFTGQDVATGQLAHIIGWSTAPGSPRGDDKLALEDRNLESNLMLLCHDQHRVIDTRSLWEVYDAAALRAIKRTHERRIRQLTALRHEDKCTVLRVVSSLHAAPVQLSASSVATALLADGRFPGFALSGVDEFEIDLRPIPGEADGRASYWAAAADLIHDRLARLATHVAKENIHHLAVFPFARVPALVALGAALDDAVPMVIYPKRRSSGEGWGWTPGSPDVSFGYSRVQAGSDPANVAVLFSVSGTVDRARLPEGASTATIYELRPEGIGPSPDLVATRASLDNFAATWRSLLADLEHLHPGLVGMDVFAAVPVTAAVAIGRGAMRAIHPRLRVFDRGVGDAAYQFALEVAP